MDPPINKFTKKEVCRAIQNLNPNKAPGYDLITAQILKQLPEVGITSLTQLFNAILWRGFVSPQWKVAQIIMILKPGKSAEEVKSYRPISLLPVPSKIMEILFLSRLSPMADRLLPDHEFGFRQNHSTIEQVQRLVNRIHYAFEHKFYCTAAFLDISQAFDRVWHEGLLFKIKSTLPTNYFKFISSYLEDRHFLIKYGMATSSLHKIQVGVPQGSVLGPTLYLLYTAELPVTEDVITGTFADDTAVMAVSWCPAMASRKLQGSLDKISTWLTD